MIDRKLTISVRRLLQLLCKISDRKEPRVTQYDYKLKFDMASNVYRSAISQHLRLHHDEGRVVLIKLLSLM